MDGFGFAGLVFWCADAGEPKALDGIKARGVGVGSHHALKMRLLDSRVTLESGPWKSTQDKFGRFQCCRKRGSVRIIALGGVGLADHTRFKRNWYS